MRLSRRQQLLRLARAGLGKLIALLLRLEAKLHQAIRERDALRRQVKELQARLALDSSNSSKPPSTDGLAKPASRSLRTQTGRRPGGQPGHPGRTLQPVAQPDHVRVHPLDLCPCGACQGRSLRLEPVLDYAKRQVFELPQKPLEVTEHQAEIKRCPVSGRRVTALFPEGVCAPAQYGPRWRAQMVYLNQQQGLPYDRLTQLCQDFYGQPLSEATVVSANERAYEQLAPFEQQLKVLLPQAPAANLDESGGRVAGKLHWVHVVSTPKLTFYGVHPQRGHEAMDEFEIVPRCHNFVIHDHFKPYFGYTQCLHALCNEHHLRELKFVFEQEHEAWAGAMSRFLLDCLATIKRQGVLDERQFKKVRRRYRAILKQGRLLHPPVAGRGAQSKAANLLRRLEGFEWSVLAFTVFEEVPFTNNGAEQDIRMVKTRLKVCGCFRTLHGARVFARIRSYISTCRKQRRNILDAMEAAIVGKPFIPSAPPAGP